MLSRQSPLRTIDRNSLIVITIPITIILSVTLIGVITLTRNTDTEIDINFGDGKSVKIKGKRPLSPSEQTKADCLPGEENSQPLNCDSQ